MASKQKNIFYLVLFLCQFEVTLSQQLRCHYNQTWTSVEEACDEVRTGFIPHPTECTAYIRCDIGIAEVHWCQGSRVFNPIPCNCVAGEICFI